MRHRHTSSGFLGSAILAAAVLVSDSGAAQSPAEAPTGVSFEASAEPQHDLAQQPPRYLVFGSAGVPLRLSVEEDFGQSRWGVTFADLLFGYVFPGGEYRHGIGVGVSWNLGHDGGYVAPIYTADQIALMPAYLGYMPITRDLVFVGHVGVPIVVRGGVGPGLELGAAVGYHLFAGAGVFAEVDLDGYAAGDASVSLMASLEVGLMINYEVLP